MTQGMVISLKMRELVPEMGNRGSKSVILYNIIVKEQRADGSSEKLYSVRCALVAGKAGSKVKRSHSIL
jgi:hypothetical protein